MYLLWPIVGVLCGIVAIRDLKEHLNGCYPSVAKPVGVEFDDIVILPVWAMLWPFLLLLELAWPVSKDCPACREREAQ
jgi:hypothetical protein